VGVHDITVFDQIYLSISGKLIFYVVCLYSNSTWYGGFGIQMCDISGNTIFKDSMPVL